MIQLEFLLDQFGYTPGSTINDSLEIGDIVYFIDDDNINDNYDGSMFETADGATGNSDFTKIGKVTAIETTEEKFTLWIDEGSNSDITIGKGDYIFFSKDNRVDLSSVVGYYGSFTFENNSPSPAELFAVSCDVVESSK